MAEIMDKIKSAFKSIASTEEKEKKETATISTIEKDAKKNEKNEYEGFASGFPEWDLQPPQAPVRRRK